MVHPFLSLPSSNGGEFLSKDLKKATFNSPPTLRRWGRRSASSRLLDLHPQRVTHRLVGRSVLLLHGLTDSLVPDANPAAAEKIASWLDRRPE